MSAHKITTILKENGQLILENLPFKKGESVEVIIVEHRQTASNLNDYPLAGKVIQYDEPLEPATDISGLGRFKMIVLDTHICQVLERISQEYRDRLSPKGTLAQSPETTLQELNKLRANIALVLTIDKAVWLLT